MTNIPTNASELQEMLSDGKKVAELVNDGKLGAVVENYASAIAKRDRDMAQQIEEQVQNTVVEFMRENGQDASKGRGLKPHANTDKRIYNAAASGAKFDKDFDGAHDFFNTIWHKNVDRATEDRRAEMKNAASSYTGADGGFLVPEETRAELLQLSVESGVVRSRARVIPMSSPSVGIPSVDDTSHASSLFGGITASWESEAQSSNATNPQFSKVVLNAHKLKAYTEVPDELMRDAVAFESFLNSAFPQALAFYEDYAFMHGTGVGQPEGFYNADAAVVVAKESGQAADTVLWENIVKVYSRMLPESLNRAVWIVPQDVFPELATMALSVGTGGSAIWLNNGVQGPPMTILGRPVIVSEKAPKLGDEGDITFVDLGYYLVGDHQTMTATSSPHYKFQQDVTAFKVVERVDGRLWLNSAVTPKNGGPTLSPVVKLAARA